MDGADDGERVAASLADWIAGLTFVDRNADEVTALVVAAVVAWGRAQGWRVYRRAASVLRLPPPYAHQHSNVDVACARPAGAPIVVEVDRADRRRSIEKLLAEAAAGRIAIWVRWGGSRFAPPPAPIRMVTCLVTSRRGVVDKRRLHSRLPTSNRPAPTHTAPGAATDAADPDAAGQQPELFAEPE
jgi:hypothetical protein